MWGMSGPPPPQGTNIEIPKNQIGIYSSTAEKCLALGNSCDYTQFAILASSRTSRAIFGQRLRPHRSENVRLRLGIADDLKKPRPFNLHFLDSLTLTLNPRQ